MRQYKRLTSQMQGVQEQMNSMSDSEGISKVSRFQSIRGDSKFLLYVSRDKRLPLDTWNAPGPQENVFGDRLCTFDSPQNHYQGIRHSTTPRATGLVTGRPVARNEDRTKDTIPMPTCARKPSTKSSLFPVDIPQNPMVGLQMSELQSTNSIHLLHSYVGR